MDGFKCFRIDKNLPMISRKTEKSSGMDLMSTGRYIIKSGTSCLISTGIKLIIPDGYEVQVRSRSGLALKHSVVVLNSPGTIDADYRGEIKVILFNHGQEDYEVKPGDSIAQAILCPVSFMTPIEINEQEFESYATDRGEGGFGSTGK